MHSYVALKHLRGKHGIMSDEKLGVLSPEAATATRSVLPWSSETSLCNKMTLTSRLLLCCLPCLPFGTKFQNTGFGNQYEKLEVFQVLRKTQYHFEFT